MFPPWPIIVVSTLEAEDFGMDKSMINGFASWPKGFHIGNFSDD